MKAIFILTMAAIIGFGSPTMVMADTFNNGWECYSDDNYRGSKKMHNSGEYDNCSSWRYNSWRTKCCVKFYYHKRNNKKGEKVVCGDVRDFRDEMKKWGDLKYGYQSLWKNVYKVKYYCEGGNETAHNDNDNNNHDNNNNDDYKDYLKKGYCIGWASSNYRNDYYRFERDKKYYGKNLRDKFWSFECPDNHEVVFYANTRSGKKEYRLDGRVSDLKSYFKKWNLQNYNDGWRYMEWFEIRKKGSGGNNHSGGNNNNNNNNNSHNNNNNDDYKDYLKKGYCIGWASSNYQQEYFRFERDKKYYGKNLRDKFWSFECPDNHEIVFYANTRSGKKEYRLDGRISDLKSYFKKWNLQNYNDGWRYMEWFEIRKKGSGGNNHSGSNNNNNSHNNNNNDDYKDYLKQGYCIGWASSNYSNDYYKFKYGQKHYGKNLRDKFWSFHCPDNYEMVFYVHTRSGKKEYRLDGRISDLKAYFKKWNLQNYNDGWKYVEWFEIRKKGSGGDSGGNNNNNYGGDDYQNKDWYKKYRNGYVVFTQYGGYDGRYQGKPAGNYDDRKLGFFAQSIYIGGSLYVVMEYKDKQGRRKSVTIKDHVPDLNDFLRSKGVYKDYEKEPYKAVTRYAVIRN